MRAGNGGHDLGWNIMEGSHCYEPAEGCDESGLTLPVAEYGHDLGCAVVGGVVIHDETTPTIDGRYIFSDNCTGNDLARDPERETDANPEVSLESGRSISAIAEDADRRRLPDRSPQRRAPAGRGGRRLADPEGDRDGHRDLRRFALDGSLDPADSPLQRCHRRHGRVRRAPLPRLASGPSTRCARPDHLRDDPREERRSHEADPVAVHPWSRHARGLYAVGLEPEPRGDRPGHRVGAVGVDAGGVHRPVALARERHPRRRATRARRRAVRPLLCALAPPVVRAGPPPNDSGDRS